MSRGCASTNQTFFVGESQTQLNGIAHEQTIICRQLFEGHVVGSRPMKRKKDLLRMIIIIIIIIIILMRTKLTVKNLFKSTFSLIKLCR